MRVLQQHLATRLLTLFLVLTIVPLAVIGYVAYESGRRTIIGDVQAHLQSVALLKQQEIDAWEQHLEHMILWQATNPQTIHSATTLAGHASDGATQAAHATLTANLKRMAALGHLSPILYLDGGSGEIVVASESAWEGRFRDADPWFIAGKRAMTVSSMVQSLSLGRPTIVIASPVLGPDGRLLGVLAGHADMTTLNEVMLERSGLGESGETYLVDSGNLLLTESRALPGVAFRKWLFTEGVSRALAGESGVALYQGYLDRPVIGAYQWLADRNLALVAEIDQAEAFAPIVALQRTLVIFGVAISVVVVALGLMIAGSITRPVRQLVEAAEAIGRGNLNTRIRVEGRDEIARLAAALNRMTRDLQVVTASRDDLNAEIAERARAEEQRRAAQTEAERLFQEVSRSRQALLRVLEQRTAAEAEVRTLNLELEQRVSLRTAQLEAANQELEAFAYSVSHDLRAPLRSMGGFSAALLSRYAGDLDDQGRHYLARIQDAAQRMGQLIDDLLNLSRVTRREMHVQPVDLSALSREIAAELRERDPERRVEITIAEGLIAQADAHLLRIVLQNLLDNAWKFTAGRPEGRIEVSTTPAGEVVPPPDTDGGLHVQPAGNVPAGTPEPAMSGDSEAGPAPEPVVYTVRDNGVGFDMAYAGRLFTPFQRLHSAQEFPGTGIGLVTVRRIITRHGGRIWVQATEDHGATFYFTLGGG